MMTRAGVLKSPDNVRRGHQGGAICMWWISYVLVVDSAILIIWKKSQSEVIEHPTVTSICYYIWYRCFRAKKRRGLWWRSGRNTCWWGKQTPLIYRKNKRVNLCVSPLFVMGFVFLFVPPSLTITEYLLYLLPFIGHSLSMSFIDRI